MKPTRRIFMQKVMQGGVSMMVLGSGLLRANEILAAWPEEAFSATVLDDSLQLLLNGQAVEISDKISLTAPDVAENGALVAVSVSSSLAAVESVSILVEHNPIPLAASFVLAPDVLADLSTRIKMSETSQVIALLKADNQFYMASREVKVTVGGCGG